MSTNNPFDIDLPDERGHFGIHGGRFVYENLTAALEENKEVYENLR